MPEIRLGDQEQAFFSKLINHRPNCPLEFSYYLAEQWRTLCSASWAFVWFFNPYIRAWELRAKDSSNSFSKEVKCEIVNGKSVVDYCVVSRNAVAIASPFDWTAKFGHKEFRVTGKQALDEQGCKSFLTIPVSFGSPTYADTPNLSVAICAHFNDLTATGYRKEDLQRLMLMAKLSDRVFHEAYGARHSRLLQKLNALSADFMSVFKDKPVTMRNNYVAEVIHLIQDEMKCRAVSLFHERLVGQPEIQCLGTSDALFDTLTKRHVNGNKLSKVLYKKNQGATGIVYATKRVKILDPRISKAVDPELMGRKKARYIETVDAELLSGKSVAICPIISSSHDRKNEATGVLRCVDAAYSRKGLERTCFDEIDVEALQFIAAQISPVLEALNARVYREQQISIIKHDLNGPISTIRHIADSLDSSESAGEIRTIPYKKLMNIKAFSIQANHLVSQLDPDLGALHAFNPIPTDLKNIVSRVSIVLRFMAKEDNDMRIRFREFYNIPFVRVDTVLIERVFFNLVVNAIKYGDSGSLIRVVPSRANDGVALDISNDGKGVAAGLEELIFEENYRANVSAKSRVMGLGLGLFIARNAMRRHGGELELLQAKGPTIFRMYFPKTLFCD